MSASLGAYAGGLIGETLECGVITNSYVTGNISASSDCAAGRLIGNVYFSFTGELTISNCHWNSDATCTSYTNQAAFYRYDDCILNGSSGLASSNMKAQEFINFLNINCGNNSSWSADIFNVNQGYPILMWQTQYPFNESGNRITLNNINLANAISIYIPNGIQPAITPILACFYGNKLLSVQKIKNYSLSNSILNINTSVDKMTIPNNTETIKIFMWNNLNEMQPLINYSYEIR